MKIYFIILGLLFVSCGSKKTVAIQEQEYLDLGQLVEEKNFNIISNWALPMLTSGMMAVSNAGLLPPGSNIGRIDISSSRNHLKIVGDSISAYLPYYGERQMGGNYNAANSGIEFNGVPITYEVHQNTKKKFYAIRFTIAEKSEKYQVNLVLLPDLSCSISVSSSQRNSIMFYGHAKRLGEE